MHDPLEGVRSRGTIRTGASRDRVSALFEPVLAAAAVAVRGADSDSSLCVHGSVATGMATSDVRRRPAHRGPPGGCGCHIARVLTVQFSDLCRAVEVADAQPGDFSGETDEAYGGRVFLRHYCVYLVGPDLHSALPDFAGRCSSSPGV
jgi:hypothetical protein